ncbi:MAG: WD40 repeat domain-containing protein [Chloroflexota bacterium]
MKRFFLFCVLAVFATSCRSAGIAAPTITPLPFPFETPASPAQVAGRIDSFAVRRDGSVIALATTRGIALYDLQSFELLRVLDEDSYAFSIDWSPDDAKLAAGMGSGENADFEGLASLRVWDTTTWQVIFDQPILEHERILDVAWSPDNRLLAMSTDVSGVMVWDTATAQRVSQQTGFAASVQSISWSPDGTRLLASSDLAYGIRRWRVSDDETVRLFDQRAGASNNVAWSPDGEWIASTHSYGDICLWQASTNRCKRFIPAHVTAAFSLAWSPKSDRFASGGGAIRIWDARTGGQLLAFAEDSRYRITYLEWPAAEGPLVSLQVAVETPETLVRFWDPANGALLAEIRNASEAAFLLQLAHVPAP